MCLILECLLSNVRVDELLVLKSPCQTLGVQMSYVEIDRQHFEAVSVDHVRISSRPVGQWEQCALMYVLKKLDPIWKLPTLVVNKTSDHFIISVILW